MKICEALDTLIEDFDESFEFNKYRSYDGYLITVSREDKKRVNKKMMNKYFWLGVVYAAGFIAAITFAQFIVIKQFV